MPATYEPIANTTASGSSNTITFSSIPQTYTDLIVVANIKGSANGYSQIQLNGSGASISRLWLTGDGSAAGTGKDANNYIIGGAYVNTGDFAFNSITHIFNYANTTTNKTLLTRASNASVRVEATVNLWQSTSAITSFTYYLSSGNMSAGSTFALYGIKAA